jgi:hypothetical protein
MRLEVLEKLKNSNNVIENRTRNRLPCSLLHQPTKLPRAPRSYNMKINN